MKKLKVLQFICPTGFYGAERWILALANNSDQDRVQHHLAVTMEPHQRELEIIRQFDSSKGQTFEIRTSGPFDFSCIKELSRIILENDIDIIHTHGYKSDILGLLAAKKTGIKSVSTPHGFEGQKKFKLRAYVKLGCIMLRFFDRVVPLSRQLEQEVIDENVPKKIISYIQNGVDLLEVDQIRKQSGNLENRQHQVIGFIGQMIERKRIHYILDIFDRLWQENPAMELRLLGDGKQRQQLESYAKNLASSKQIHFLGFRTDSLIQLKNLDLFVMTSVSEGIPRCLMEALGMGIPVAAFNIQGIDQLIKHNETGLLADFGDTITLYNHMQSILTDESLATKLSDSGREFVHEHFSATRMAREYLSLYDELLG